MTSIPVKRVFTRPPGVQAQQRRGLLALASSSYTPALEIDVQLARWFSPRSCNAKEELRDREEAVALPAVNERYDSVLPRDKGAPLRNSATWSTSRNLRRSMPGRPMVSSLPAKQSRT
jgi:hypothetical protein